MFVRRRTYGFTQSRCGSVETFVVDTSICMLFFVFPSFYVCRHRRRRGRYEFMPHRRGSFSRRFSIGNCYKWNDLLERPKTIKQEKKRKILLVSCNAKAKAEEEKKIHSNGIHTQYLGADHFKGHRRIYILCVWVNALVELGGGGIIKAKLYICRYLLCSTSTLTYTEWNGNWSQTLAAKPTRYIHNVKERNETFMFKYVTHAILVWCRAISKNQQSTEMCIEIAFTLIFTHTYNTKVNDW